MKNTLSLVRFALSLAPFATPAGEPAPLPVARRSSRLGWIVLALGALAFVPAAIVATVNAPVASAAVLYADKLPAPPAMVVKPATEKVFPTIVLDEIVVRGDKPTRLLANRTVPAPCADGETRELRGVKPQFVTLRCPR